MIYYLGIDPGYAAGAVCLLSEDLTECHFFDIGNGCLPSLCDFFKTWAPKIKFGVLEKVNSSPLMGVVSAFNFGKGVGWVEGLLTMYSIPFECITPQKWQSLTGPRPLKEDLPYDADQKTRNKIRAKNKRDGKEAVYQWAKARFPQAELRSFSKDSNRSDAIGIAFYGWSEYRSLEKVA